MSNSDLSVYRVISPNRTSPRNHVIDTITPHCFVGQVSCEDAAGWFKQESAQCSCNYFIDPDGRIITIVDEEDRSWCTSSRDNDNRAVTVEVASDKTHPYAITDKAYKALVKLCADICKRNNIDALRWKADKNLIGQPDKQNITVHRWFANKECPGEYIYSRLGKIAEEVNAILGTAPEPKPAKTQAADINALGSEAEKAAAMGRLIKPLLVGTGLFPSIFTGQKILESGYCGTNLALGANNIAGMKCKLSENTWPNSTWDGISKFTKISEEQRPDGSSYWPTSDFRKYPCIEDSILDCVAYLKGAVKEDGSLRYAGIENCKTPEEQLKLIKAGGYATDVRYVEKIMDICRRFDLFSLDSDTSSPEPKPEKVWYRVGVSWKNGKCVGQVEADENIENAKKTCDKHYGYSVFDPDGKVVYTNSKTKEQDIVEKAVAFAVETAEDDGIGYFNGGYKPEQGYCCISLVVFAYINAGLPVPYCNVWDAPSVFLGCGFRDVTDEVDINTGAGMIPGDLVWRDRHIEMVCAPYQLVGARGDFDGQPGDSSGNEISVIPYSNGGWKRVFRLPVPEKRMYRVQVGAFEKKANADKREKLVKEKTKPFDPNKEGFPCFREIGSDGMIHLYCGSFEAKSNAEERKNIIYEATNKAVKPYIKEV